MLKFLSKLLICTSLVTSAVYAKTPESSLVVQTDNGKVAGVVRNGAKEFRGIPFAAAPVGDLRWELPQPAKPWTGVRDASAFGSACPQQARFNLTDESLNEDCLFLNVSVPKDIKPHEKLPVLFWIHGGAFVGGASSLYRLDKLASDGRMVVVSTNYRLGVLGFMPHSAFAKADGLNGNYGLEDQRAAMRWVQRNIASFGGDPTQVTVAGESAGAGSVCAHISSPDNVKGLFSKAIILSGGCLQSLKTMQEAESTGTYISDAVGCKGTNAEVLACMRHSAKASVSNLLQVQGEYAAKFPADLIPFSIVPGTSEKPNRTFPQTTQRALDTGTLVPVPLMMGGARSELRLYVAYWWQEAQEGKMPPINSKTFNAWLSKLYSGKPAQGDKSYAQLIEAEYKPASGWSSEQAVPAALGTVLSDFIPTVGINNCLFLKMADALQGYSTKHVSVPLYQFEFADANALVNGVGIAKPYPDFELGAVHSSALNYLFPGYSNNSKINAPELPTASQKLAKTMLRQWSAFVKSGTPDKDWPLYKGGNTVMRWEPGNVGLYDAAAQHKCAFWNGLYSQP